MKKRSFPRNKNITVRVTATEEFIYKNIAKKNNLSTSAWANFILKDRSDNKDISDQLLEIIDDTIVSLKSTSEKINPEDERLPKFSIAKGDLQLLKVQLLRDGSELRSIKNKLIELKKNALIL